MLLSLQIRNYLLVDYTEIDFSQGLCVITGETGAGKSIILNCINFILGAKINNKIIRVGENLASATAIFDISNNKELKKYLQEIELDISVDDNLMIRRTIDSNNRTKIYLDKNLINLNTLKIITSFLIEIHGQHEQSALTEVKTHKFILDEYGNNETFIMEVEKNYNDWKDIENELKRAQQEFEKSKQEEEYLIHLIKEIKQLNPKIGEENFLALKRSDLQAKDKIIHSLKMAVSELTEVSQIEKSLLSASKIISKINVNDNVEYNSACDALDRASIEISNVVNLLELKIDELINSEENIEDIEKRLFTIKSISRKYNKPADELNDYLEESMKIFENINHQDKNLKKLEIEQKNSKSKYIESAKILSDKRKKYAQNLESEIKKELSYLKMEKAEFRVNFKELDENLWSKYGIDQIKFEAITNPGQEFSNLSETASGGELSRFMLAIKVILSKNKSNITLIFDEIDSGIGGVVADLVANRLSALASDNQILLITHQAQIAAKASMHLFVKKEQSELSTKTIVKELSKEEKYDELARMLAGSNVTSEVMAVAKQLTNI